MRSFICYISLLLFSITALKASEQDSLFAVGNQLYQQKNYTKAFQVLDGLVKEGVQSDELYFNYANTCLQTEQYSRAIAYYSKVLKNSHQDVATFNNLLYAQKQLGVTDSFTSTFLQPWSSTTIYTVTIFLLWISILMIITAVLFLRNKNRKCLLMMGGVGVIVTTFFTVISVMRYQEEEVYQYGVAIQESILYREPSTLSMEVYDVFDGQRVRIIEQDNGWLHIQTDNKKSGWVASEHIIMI